LGDRIGLEYAIHQEYVDLDSKGKSKKYEYGDRVGQSKLAQRPAAQEVPLEQRSVALVPATI